MEKQARCWRIREKVIFSTDEEMEGREEFYEWTIAQLRWQRVCHKFELKKRDANHWEKGDDSMHRVWTYTPT